MRNIHVVQANREPVRGDVLLRHIWKNSPNECISWWRYNETVDIDNVRQYTTLNGSFRDIVSSFKVQNVYITNDEEIKEGDWVIFKGEDGRDRLMRIEEYCWTTDERKIYKMVGGGLTSQDMSKKIILTTDQDLIKCGVQPIDDEFLEWFVNNQRCEWVDVKKLFKANPKYNEATRLTEKVGYWEYKIIISKQSTKDRIMSETSEETKQKARDYGNSLIKQDRTCTHNCSAVCGECQILEPKPLPPVEWLLRYIEDLNNKGYTFIPSSNKEIVEHIKQMEKDNMIAFLKFVFQQDGFDYEQAYNNFLKQQIL